LKAGDGFGRFVIEGILGEGGMGSVYRAFDTVLGRRVALKLLRADAIHGGTDRLLREARAAAALDHVNAIAIHDSGEVGGVSYIAMELVVGRSMRAYVGDPTVAISTRLRWLRDVAHALEAAHARGLVHRDIKPENVMIRTDGVVKVLDFGIASPAGSAPEGEVAPLANDRVVDLWRATLSTGAALVGTPRYMSPEQLHGSAIDGRADQFAWGVTAYELLAGVPPWSGDTMSLTTLVAVLEREPARLRGLAPDVPARVDTVIHRTLAKNPDLRFPSMRGVIDALEAEPALLGGWRRSAVAVIAALVLGAALYVTPAGTPRPEPMATSEDREPPHVVLWLDAASGLVTSGRRVTRWADRSGNHNDASAGDRAPELVPRAINGHPAVHFDGTYLTVADAAPLHIGTGDFVIAAVVRQDRRPAGDAIAEYGLTTGYGAIVAKQAQRYPFAGVALFTNYPRPARSTKLGIQTDYNHYVLSASDQLDDGRPRLVVVRRTRGSLEIRIAGVTEARIDNDADDVSAPGVALAIGAHPTERGLIQQLRGDLAEIVILRGPVYPDYLARLETDLKTKYRL